MYSIFALIFNYTSFSFIDVQEFLLMSRKRKALSTNLKYMKRTINVKVFSDLFHTLSLSPKCIFFVDFGPVDNYFKAVCFYLPFI